jgi:Adenylate and Guanylate cyclase catalytic domain
MNAFRQTPPPASGMRVTSSGVLRIRSGGRCRRCCALCSGHPVALHEANAVTSAECQMSLRIGINVGYVLVKDGTIFGDGVNVASRLEALAEPGSVCITHGVRDHIRIGASTRISASTASRTLPVPFRPYGSCWTRMPRPSSGRLAGRRRRPSRPKSPRTCRRMPSSLSSGNRFRPAGCRGVQRLP